MDWDEFGATLIDEYDISGSVEEFAGYSDSVLQKNITDRSRFYEQLGGFADTYKQGRNALPFLGPKGVIANVGFQVAELGVEAYLAYNE